MITLAAAGTIQGAAGTATAVTYTITGMELASGTETYTVLAQGQLAASVGALYTVGAGTTAFVKSIMLANATASPVTGVSLLVNGTAAGNQIVPAITIQAYGMAILDDNGLKLYDGGGNLYTTYTPTFDAVAPTVTTPRSISAPGTVVNAAHRDHTHQSPGGFNIFTSTSSAINVSETLVSTASLPANIMQVGTTLRVIATGTCTSSAANASNLRVRIGTAQTTGDAVAAVVTPTSATSGSGVPFRVEFLVTIRSAGSTGTALGSGVLLNNGITGISSSAYPVVSQNTGTVTVDTTAINYVQFWYISANTTTTSTFYNVSFEIVKM